ncbi:MAG: hypothetical protein ACR2KJ_13130 [Jatrophihabitans sp.]
MGLRTARAVAAEALQRGWTSLTELEQEIRRGPRRWSANLRMAIDEMARGVRSSPEAEAMHLLESSAVLSGIAFNADLRSPAGTFVARPDAWLAAAAMAVEVDSAAHHFMLEDWEHTQRRVALLASYGALVLSVSPFRLRTEPSRLLAEIERAYLARRAAGVACALRVCTASLPR